MPFSAYLSGAADAVLKGMSTLVPEKRADKNGVMVTRHVKLPSTVVGKTIVPAPSITRSVIAEGVIEGVMDTFSSSVSGNKGFNQSVIFESLKQLPDSTLNFISTVLNKNEGYVTGIDCILISLLASDSTAMEIEDAFFVFDGLRNRDRYNDIMKSSDDVPGGLAVGAELQGFMRDMEASSLNGFAYLPGEVPLRFQDESVRMKASALFEMAQMFPAGSIDGEGQQSSLHDTEMAQLFVDYPENTDELSDLVESGDAVDAYSLREAMTYAA